MSGVSRRPVALLASSPAAGPGSLVQLCLDGGDLLGEVPRPPKAEVLDDATFPGYAMGPAAGAIGVTPAFLRAAEAAGLFEIHRSDGGHRRYSRDDLERADRARQLVDDGIRMDAAARIVSLEYQLAAAHAMIEILRRKTERPKRVGEA